MNHWLHKYIFRGIGWVLLAGLLTNLYLAISSHRHRAPQVPAILERRAPGDKR